MNLVRRCLSRGWTRIAFIGATKHAGKTTAMNAFIAAASLRQQAEGGPLPLGLLSIGLDGERIDTILGVQKPAIEAPVGTLVATAERALTLSDARFELLEALPIPSPLGQVLIARVTSAGGVVLAGVRQRAHVDQIVPRLTAYGARACCVDGAFDRMAAAAPQLVDAAVLAVGAVAGRTVADVVALARPIILRFQLPTAPTHWQRLFAKAQATGAAAFSNHAGVHVLTGQQLAQRLPSHAAWDESVAAVWLPGAFSDGVAAQLRGHAQSLDIIVGHPAQVLASDDSLRRLAAAGHRLFVWRSLPIAAIAANPHSITGYDLPKDLLQAALAQLAPDVPVFDAVDSGGDVDAV